MKRLIQTVCLFAILLLPLSAAADVGLERIWQYMPTLSAVKGADYVILGSRIDNMKGLYSTTGEEVLPFAYPNLASLGSGFFSDYSNTENVNARAILYEDGRQISEYAYGSAKAIDRHWAVGITLKEAAEEAYDVKLSNKFYLYDRCDLFYVDEGERDSYLVGSIDGRAFVEAAAHGPLLAIKDHDGLITVYDRDMTASPSELEKVGNSLFSLDEEYRIVNSATGQVLAEEYASVSESRFSDGMWVIGTRYNMNGTKYSHLMDEKGEVAYALKYPVSSANRRYAVITDGNKKRGLYSLEEDRVLIPAEYDEIYSSGATLDGYFANGYIAVKRDNMAGFIDMRTGEISCDIKYPTNGLKRVGCTMYYVEEDGIRLIAADGVESLVKADGVQDTRGDGFLMIVKKDNRFGVVDWHGQEVLPMIFAKAPVITDDSQAIILSSTGLELNRITR